MPACQPKTGNRRSSAVAAGTLQKLLSRRDVIIVSSVSCIYGLGSPEDYAHMILNVVRGETLNREKMLLKLVDMQYVRTDIDFKRGRFRVRGDVIDILPAYRNTAYRVELFGDEVDRITELDPLTGEVLGNTDVSPVSVCLVIVEVNRYPQLIRR